MIANSIVELLPTEFLVYALALQRGDSLHWSALRALVRNGLAVRRVGTWGLTSAGLAAAGLARHRVEAGELTMDAALEPYVPSQPPSRDELSREDQTDPRVDLSSNELLDLLEAEWAAREIGIEMGDQHADFVSSVQAAPHPNPPQTASLYPLGHKGEGTVTDREALLRKQLPGLFADVNGALPSSRLGSVMIRKDRNGAYRWVAISSSGYRDVDGELITRKALAEDVARARADGDYGPLVWWHGYKPLLIDQKSGQHLIYKAIVLGHCDFNAMAGPQNQFLLESGTFKNETIAKAMANNADKLAVSIQFTYRKQDLGADGVYERVRRRERSLLKRGKEANLFTSFMA